MLVCREAAYAAQAPWFWVNIWRHSNSNHFNFEKFRKILFCEHFVHKNYSNIILSFNDFFENNIWVNFMVFDSISVFAVPSWFWGACPPWFYFESKTWGARILFSPTAQMRGGGCNEPLHSIQRRGKSSWKFGPERRNPPPRGKFGPEGGESTLEGEISA